MVRKKQIRRLTAICLAIIMMLCPAGAWAGGPAENADAAGMAAASSRGQAPAPLGDGGTSGSGIIVEGTSTGAVTFGVLSDVHITASTATNEAKRLKTALEFFAQNGAASTFLVGDIVDWGYEDQFITYKSVVDASARGAMTVHETMGNHEFLYGNTREHFTQYTGDEPSAHYTVNGYHFIMVSPEDSTVVGGNYSTETITWLGTQLAAAKADTNNKPIFVFFHHPIRDTYYVTNEYYGNISKEVFRNYPQAVVFSGHIHSPNNIPTSIWQDGFTAVNTVSLTYFEMEKGYGSGTKPDNANQCAQGLLVSVEGTVVTIKTRDFISGQYIDDQIWTFDTAATTFPYNTESRKAASLAPVFDGDAAITRVLAGSSFVRFTHDQARTATGDITGDIVYSYRYELSDSEGNVVSNKKDWSNFHMLPMPETLTRKISGLQPETDYTLRIYPINAYGEESEDCLTVRFTTISESQEPIDPDDPTMEQLLEEIPRADLLDVDFSRGEPVDLTGKATILNGGTARVDYDAALGRNVAVSTGEATDVWTTSAFSASDYEKITDTGATIEALVKVDVFPDYYAGLISNYGSSGIGLGLDKERPALFGDPELPVPILTAKATTAKEWHHLMGVFDGAQVSLYVDGVLADDNQFDLPDLSVDRKFVLNGGLGYNALFGSTVLNGSLASARIYSEPVSAWEAYRIAMAALPSLDTQAPKTQFASAPAASVRAGRTYTLPAYIAADNSGVCTTTITLTGPDGAATTLTDAQRDLVMAGTTYTPTVAGTYTLTYSSVDGAENKTEKILTVTVFPEASGNELIRGTFSYAANEWPSDEEPLDLEATCIYSDDYFAGSAYDKNPHLATMSMAMALASGNSQAEPDYAKKSSNITDLLGKLGFQYIEVNEDYTIKPTTDTMGVAVGHKPIKVDGEDEDFTLLAVVPRSAGYEAEWGSNFIIGESGPHAGFASASAIVLDFMKDYIEKYTSSGSISGKVKLWIPGHSRGGAVASLLGAALVDDSDLLVEVDVQPQDIYVYAFSAPRYVPDSMNPQDEKYKNIHNYLSEYDLVTMMPLKAWGLERYGTETMLPDQARKARMLGFLQEINPTVYNSYRAGGDPDNFSLWEVELTDESPGYNIVDAGPAPQKEFLKERLEALEKIASGGAIYAEEYQEVLSTIVGLVMGLSVEESDELIKHVIEDEDAIGAAVQIGFYNLVKQYGESNGIGKDVPAADVLQDMLDSIKGNEMLQGNVLARELLNSQTYIELEESIEDLAHYGASYEFLVLYLKSLEADYPLYELLYRMGPKITDDSYTQVVIRANSGALTELASALLLYTESDSTDPVDLLFEELGTAATLVSNAGSLLTPHYGEVVLAWLQTMDSYYDPAPRRSSSKESALTVPVSGDAGSVAVSATVSGGTASVSVTEEQLAQILSGGEESGPVTVDVSGLKGVDSAEIPAEIVAAAESAGAGGLEVILPTGKVALDSTALSAVSGQATGEDITVSISPVAADDLTDEQKETVGDAPVFNISITSGGRSIVSLGEGRAWVTLPYELPEGQDPKDLVVYFLDGEGKLHPCETVYDPVSNTLRFATDHFSLYVVGYDETLLWENPFTDVAENDWFYNSVAYVNAAGLMQGTSATTFGPRDNITRGMVVTVLWRLEGEPVSNYYMTFPDVDENAWYGEAVRWAAGEGIVNGYDSGGFGPADPITREQLAAVLYRYAQHKGYDVSVGEDTNILSYNDAFDIREYAIPAIQWACGAGLLNGTDKGDLLPQGNATRAQTAAILQRFCTMD